MKSGAWGCNDGGAGARSVYQKVAEASDALAAFEAVVRYTSTQRMPRRPKEPPVPQERTETVRHAIVEELRKGALTARDLAARIGLLERDTVPHLEHLERSLRGRGERFELLAARCLGCGYSFEDRRALSKPSRCPRCRGERIEAPRFRVW